MHRLFDFNVINGWIDALEVTGPGLSADNRSGCISKDNQFCYIPIPKNASSECRQMFNEADWLQVYDASYLQDPQINEYVVILRDPTDHWVSGIAEFLVGAHSKLGKENIKSNVSEEEVEQFIVSPLFRNILSNFVIFDAHTLPQCCFLRGIRLEKIKFFYFDSTVINRVSEYTGVQYTATNANQSLTNPKKTIIITKLKEMLNNDPELQRVIDMHYEADYKLFDCVKF